MISKLLTIGALAFGVASLPISAANAGGADKDGGFYATPIQHGAPRDLPGEQLVPGANLAVDVIDGVAHPLVVNPIQTAGNSIAEAAAGGPPPAAAPAKVAGHRAGHHAHRTPHARRHATHHHTKHQHKTH